jgi:hypothetical protein
LIKPPLVAVIDAVSLCRLTTQWQSVDTWELIMLIFIDESGDPGLKMGNGSSKYFIVALVAFEEREEALAADNRISLLRTEQGLPDDFEFHFNKMKPAYRRTFLEAVAPCSFVYFGIVINKARLAGREFQFRGSIYEYACGLLLQEAKPRVNNAIIVIDENGSKNLGRELRSSLVRQLKDDSGKRFIKNVRTQNSTKNNLLQLADMVVGSIARTYSGKKDSHEYRRLIAHREINVQFWPK